MKGCAALTHCTDFLRYVPFKRSLVLYENLANITIKSVCHTSITNHLLLSTNLESKLFIQFEHFCICRSRTYWFCCVYIDFNTRFGPVCSIYSDISISYMDFGEECRLLVGKEAECVCMLVNKWLLLFYYAYWMMRFDCYSLLKSKNSF